MSKILIISIQIIYLFHFSFQICEIYTNHCNKCNELTNLCEICENDAYKPNNEGGCELIKECKINKNYCIKCNEDICISCENNYFPDENGGCSYTDNCLISSNGICYQCKEDYFLIIDNNYNLCKYQYLDEYKNCYEVDYTTGKCIDCIDGYYLSSEDEKCTNTDDCKKSLYGICEICEDGYYLDKNDNDLCKKSIFELSFCKLTLDGITCNECEEEYYLTEKNLCTSTKNCKISKIGSICELCNEGYYLSNSGICTKEKNCLFGNGNTNLCEICQNSFYFDSENKKCISNQENNKYKYCSEVISGICTNCEINYYRGNDLKCSNSKNCLESENGICIKCEINYHLGLDNKCTNIKYCIYSDDYGNCLECENSYYYDYYKKECLLDINKFENCKKVFNDVCEICKDGYYLYLKERKCYNNEIDGLLYKCGISNWNGTQCEICQNGYYLGFNDLKCTKIKDCAISENENKCIECISYRCLDIKKGMCYDNDNGPKEINQKIYYACNITNEEGTECALCKDEYYQLENGICVNKVECEEEKDGECIKCLENDHNMFYMCLNKIYGCVKTITKNCLRCDNILDFYECTECKEGYILNNRNECIKIE